MLKSTWTLIALGVLVAAAGGGAYYYTARNTIKQQALPSEATPQPLAPSTLQSDGIGRSTLESIGTIENLKPVPLQPASPR